MAISREIKQEFVKMRELDGANFEECASELQVGIATVKRWVHTDWYAEMREVVRVARNAGLAEEAKAAVKADAASIIATESEWESKRRVYIQRVRNTVEDAVIGLERIAEEIKEPNHFDDMRDYKSAVESHGRLTDTARKLLMVEHEEKLAVATAQAAASQRMSAEEISCLSEAQLRVLIDHGMERLKEGDGKIVEME